VCGALCPAAAALPEAASTLALTTRQLILNVTLISETNICGVSICLFIKDDFVHRAVVFWTRMQRVRFKGRASEEQFETGYSTSEMKFYFFFKVMLNLFLRDKAK